MKHLLSRALLAAAVLTLVGCAPADSSLASMSNHALAEQAYRCRNTSAEMAPGRAVACGNVDRVCKERSDTAGYHIC